MNALKHKAEFRLLLANYQLSFDSLKILSRVKLVLLVAPTSSGRNTIIRELLKTGDYHFIISDTTRQQRVNDGVPERSGVEYWFRSETDMLADIRAGKYLEAAIIHNQQVSGISIRELEKASVQNKIAITDAEIAGVHNATKYKPDTLAVFVLPPSFTEWQQRLKQRNQVEPDEYHRRMTSAAKEFEAALQQNYYKFIINDDYKRAASCLDRLAKSGQADPAEQHAGHALAEQLLADTKKFLKTLN